ncbi:MAG: S9 family peptidase [Phycisphaerae bacterium]
MSGTVLDESRVRRYSLAAAGAPLKLRSGHARRTPFRSLRLLAAALVCLANNAVQAEDPELIPRSVLFGNPDRASPQLNKDGTRLAFLAPAEGVLNVWVAPSDRPADAKPLTKETQRGIRTYFWAYSGEHILYRQDKGGDENWRIFCADVNTGEIRDLTPYENVQARVQEISEQYPNEVLVALNRRDPKLHDIFRVNILTGEMKPVAVNHEGFLGYLTDSSFALRFGLKVTTNGGQALLQRDGQEWKPFAEIPPADSLTTSPVGFDRAGDTLYMLDSRGRNTAALMAFDLKAGAARILAEDSRTDAVGTLMHPVERRVQAVQFNYDRACWRVLDESIQKDFDYLASVSPGDLSVVSRTLDDRQWIVAYAIDNGPVRYVRYDRDRGNAELLFTNNAALEKAPLAPMHVVLPASRDGLTLVSYLTLPLASDPDGDARPDRPLPMVLFVHGGPWARDEWGYSANHQWLANRGYAVLSVNFRGSTGFGKNFTNAGDREWGEKMHEDLLDAVEWATREKIADPKRIAIMGGSYGGYATLAGLTFTPDVFACGVDIVGPSSLVTLLESIPPYWTPMIEMFTQRIGDHRTDDGRKFLLSRSPISHVQNIRRPLLIGQGANDPRVKQAESDQIVKVMQDKQIPVTYVLYPDEGHGFARPENRASFYAVAEAFLAQHLGGRVEPVGDDFRGSSIRVPVGAEQIPGLRAALATGG